MKSIEVVIRPEEIIKEKRYSDKDFENVNPEDIAEEFATYFKDKYPELKFTLDYEVFDWSNKRLKSYITNLELSDILEQGGEEFYESFYKLTPYQQVMLLIDIKKYFDDIWKSLEYNFIDTAFQNVDIAEMFNPEKYKTLK